MHCAEAKPLQSVTGLWVFWGFVPDRMPPSMPTGIASVVVSFFLSMYYNVINAWAFWYLFHSFQVCGCPVARLDPTVATWTWWLCISAGCCPAPSSAEDEQKLQKPSQGFSGVKR